MGKLIAYRMKRMLTGEKQAEPKFPAYKDWYLPMAGFIQQNKLTADDALLLLIGIIPHVEPGLFDQYIDQTLSAVPDYKGEFPRIGGARGKNSRFFLPTGETALFLIAGEDLSKRLQVQQLFGAEHIFWEKKILWLEDMQNGEPPMHGRLIISPDYADLLIYGKHTSPQFSIIFTAKKIAPSKTDEKQRLPTLEDLVIPDEAKAQIDELKSWLSYNEVLMNQYGMKDRLKKGYRALFYGPPGTGKTFAAQILGNDLHKEVYRIDLSMVVSKYIGETEKNLELLFARAEDKGWILFFDEADALFGKRTNVRDAHDKYANQEVSYLLQRMEDYNGLVILATNMKNNIDEAFIRRFNLVLKFPFPDQNQRALIWQKALPKNAVFLKKAVSGDPAQVRDEEADIPAAVKKYELTGGNIINIVQYTCIKAIEAMHEKGGVLPKKLNIYQSDVIEGVKRELLKEGKPFSP
ncbi:MAG TPA: ATP-binding protein [Bryobacteraceae bacterium]